MEERVPESQPEPVAQSQSLAQEELAAAQPAVARWVHFVFTCAGIAVVPWSAYLAISLPRTSQSGHYRIAWVGFDLFLAWTLFRVGWIAGRGPAANDRVELPATAAATLLLVDAWFDTTTSADRGSFVAALILAVVAEVPLALLCLWIAHRAEDIRERRLVLVPILERLARPPR
jgi:hypothetical protein